MYVTRPLSHYIKNQDSLSYPPDGPNSGFLVIEDEESENYCCFGLCKYSLKNLPFPQNKELTVRNPAHDTRYESETRRPILLIPVLNEPLSSNRYYAIKTHGKHKGKACTCSREEDMSTCCFCQCVNDVKPRELNPNNIYQQFNIYPYSTTGHFFAKLVERDGFPPKFLRKEGWLICTETPKHFKLDEALGPTAELRARLPELNVPLSCKTSEPVTVGNWYCPFVFVKERSLKDQVKTSMYYKMTLEQRWEQIFMCKNEKNRGNSVLIDVSLENEEVYVDGNKAALEENMVHKGVMWFRSSQKGIETSVGLRMEIVDRLKWEQNRGGWQSGGDRKVMINRVEESGENRGWREFGCYVLVERFVLKRMDDSLVMTYSFLHIH